MIWEWLYFCLPFLCSLYKLEIQYKCWHLTLHIFCILLLFAEPFLLIKKRKSVFTLYSVFFTCSWIWMHWNVRSCMCMSTTDKTWSTYLRSNKSCQWKVTVPWRVPVRKHYGNHEEIHNNHECRARSGTMSQRVQAL